MSGIKRADVARIVALYESWSKWKHWKICSFVPPPQFIKKSLRTLKLGRASELSKLVSHGFGSKAYGGVYADIDVEAARCFDPLLRAAENARMGVLLGEARDIALNEKDGCVMMRRK